jgi:hypothetical protein
MKLMEDIFAAVAAGDRTMLLDSLADDVTMRVTGQQRILSGVPARMRQDRRDQGVLRLGAVRGGTWRVSSCADWDRGLSDGVIKKAGWPGALARP